jgi:hypothetical protein
MITATAPRSLELNERQAAAIVARIDRLLDRLRMLCHPATHLVCHKALEDHRTDLRKIELSRLREIKDWLTSSLENTE